MSDKVLIFVADEKYLPHYKALAVNCRREGQYDGEYCMIVPHGMDTNDLETRGFRVFRTNLKGFLAKFDVFNPFFRRWKQAMYMDADIIVQLPMQPLFDQLTNWPLNVFGKKNIIASREEVPVFMGWQVRDPDWDKHTFIYETMRDRFPHFFSQDKMWNTAVMLFEPESIPEDTVQRLCDLQDEFGECNIQEKGGNDEPIIDLLLHNRISQVAEKGWCYWGLDNENARVMSISRGWRGDEVPVMLHYCRWYAPWVVKKPDMDAYLQLRLNKPCHEFYQENLDAFDTVFPRG